MRLLFLPDPPTSRRLFRNRTAYGETDVGVGIQHDVARLEQLVQILRRLSQPRRALRKLLDVHTGRTQSLCGALHLPWIKYRLANGETLPQLENRPLNGLLK